MASSAPFSLVVLGAAADFTLASSTGAPIDPAGRVGELHHRRQLDEWAVYQPGDDERDEPAAGRDLHLHPGSSYPRSSRSEHDVYRQRSSAEQHGFA